MLFLPFPIYRNVAVFMGGNISPLQRQHGHTMLVTDDPHLPTFEKCPKTIIKFTKRIGYIGQEAV